MWCSPLCNGIEIVVIGKMGLTSKEILHFIYHWTNKCVSSAFSISFSFIFIHFTFCFCLTPVMVVFSALMKWVRERNYFYILVDSYILLLHEGIYHHQSHIIFFTLCFIGILLKLLIPLGIYLFIWLLLIVSLDNSSIKAVEDKTKFTKRRAPTIKQ